MKTLEEFDMIREFLGAQGIRPTAAMVCVDDAKWSDLKFLARSWKDAIEDAARQQEEELAGLSEEELELRAKQAREEALLENDRLLFHSSGYRPEKT